MLLPAFFVDQSQSHSKHGYERPIMRDGYDPSDGEDGASAGLDEFLCEYVDGTMDPAVRAAFEEYLRLNPSLYEHIDCLRETRSMLCRYGCRLRAPAALQQRLRERLGEELLAPAPVMPSVATHLSWIAGFSSLLLLAFGFLATSEGIQRVQPPDSHQVVEARSAARPLVSGAASFGSFPSAAVLWQPSIDARTSSARSAGLTQPALNDTFLTAASPMRPMLSLSAATLP